MAKKGVLLTDKDENFLYPQTILEMVTNKEQTATLDVLLKVLRENLESSIENTNLNVSNLRDELNALLSDETLSGEVRDAILELNSLLNSGSSDITSEVLTSIRQLKEDAVLHSEQSLTSTQKQQARQNIDAVGVVTTYGDGGSWATLSYNDKTIYPETKGKQVKMSNGSSVEDAINTNTSNITANTENIKEKIGLVGSPTVENGVQSGTLGYKNQPLFPTTRDNKVFVQSKSRTLDVVINDIETDISKESTRAQQVEMYLESQKANKYGYYEGLSVGVSDNLSGRGEATDSEFTMRPSGGENKSIEDGTARINSIKGNSVVLNQLIRTIFKNNEIKTITDNGITFTQIDDTTYTVVGTNNSNEYAISNTESPNFEFVANRKYIFIVSGLDWDCYVNLYSDTAIGFPSGIIKSTIFSISSGGRVFLRLSVPSSKTVDRTVKLKIIDLTKMFRAGNEPTTVEEFEALYCNMPDEYNAGNIIDNHTTAIKSVGVNAWDEQDEAGFFNSNLGIPNQNKNTRRSKNYIKVIPNAEYHCSAEIRTVTAFTYDKDKNFIGTIYDIVEKTRFTIPVNCHYVKLGFGSDVYPCTKPVKNVCLHLYHTGYLNGKHFPYESQIRQLPTVEGGLKSAGSAYDEIRYNKGKDKWEHIQRVGSVYLGTLDWEYGSYVNVYAYRASYDGKPSFTNLLTDTYVNGGAINASDLEDKMFRGNNSTPTIYIRDDSYTDVATFKTAISGVILYYELAEPVITELDVDISPDYKVWDYGTEEAISEVLSTPVRINSNYGFNAVGQITDNTELIKELLARVAVLEAQVAQQTSAVALAQDVDE